MHWIMKRSVTVQSPQDCLGAFRIQFQHLLRVGGGVDAVVLDRAVDLDVLLVNEQHVERRGLIRARQDERFTRLAGAENLFLQHAQRLVAGRGGERQGPVRRRLKERGSLEISQSVSRAIHLGRLKAVGRPVATAPLSKPVHRSSACSSDRFL
eukprot:Selendium_serpulae@DN180_c0_g1_i1.p1